MLCTVMDRGRSDFERFVVEVEPRVRRALVAGFGAEVGRQAAADALARAWQNWERMRDIDSPVGYLYRVGRTLALRSETRIGFEVRLFAEDGTVVEQEIYSHWDGGASVGIDGGLALRGTTTEDGRPVLDRVPHQVRAPRHRAAMMRL
jgi:DNA-directed RNA polymerase specialized sigma24 family protein